MKEIIIKVTVPYSLTPDYTDINTSIESHRQSILDDLTKVNLQNEFTIKSEIVI